MIDKQPILITGCARSGTSLTAGIIDLCGAFGGVMSGPNKNNPKGMFENAEIRNNVVKKYYEEIGVDPLGQYPMANINRLKIPNDWRDRVEPIMVRQGYPGGEWFYKGAKMCQHWPVWNYAYPNAKWIIVRRKDDDIIKSCLRAGFMRAFHNPNTCKAVGARTEHEGWRWWVSQHKRRFVEMVNAGLNIKVVWPERMLQGDFQQMKEAVEWCGLPWRHEACSFVAPQLWKRGQK